jgi:DNA-binding transcriptional ArsR family regulator
VPARADLPRTFSALGDPTRLAIVRLLGKKPLRSSDIADALDADRPTTSRHLRVLRQSGIVEETSIEDDARVRVYRLRREAFAQVGDWLAEVEAFWSDQLGAFKRHLERQSGGRRR